MTSLQDCIALDAQDPLRELRQLFALPDGVIYLDGNSLGVLPAAAPARTAKVVTEEWGQGLIRSWNNAGWFDLPVQLGDRIATLIGASAEEVCFVRNTSHGLGLVAEGIDWRPGDEVAVAASLEYPSNVYVWQHLALLGAAPPCG